LIAAKDKIFVSSPKHWGPPSFLCSKYRGLFLWGIKLPGHAADHSPSYRAEVKNELNYTSTFPLMFTFVVHRITFIVFNKDSADNDDDDQNNNIHLCCGCLLHVLEDVLYSLIKTCMKL